MSDEEEQLKEMNQHLQSISQSLKRMEQQTVQRNNELTVNPEKEVKDKCHRS